jgi:hypothetical protein
MTEHQKNLDRRKKIAEKLKLKGKPVIHRTFTQGEYDPETGSVQNIATDQRSYALEMDFTIQERGNPQIGVNDRKLMLSTENIRVEPKIADQIIMNPGKPNEAVSAIRFVSPFEPATVLLYYDLVISR